MALVGQYILVNFKPYSTAPVQNNMKKILFFVLTFIIAFTGFNASCQKGNNMQTVQVTAADTGKTISIAQGETIKLTLQNPGDGGYAFDAPKFDASILNLGNHAHNSPAAGNVSGNFGTDTWEFTAKSSGSTLLTVTASRSWDKAHPVTIFNGTIAVK
jgi:predicted secreted protein